MKTNLLGYLIIALAVSFLAVILVILVGSAFNSDESLLCIIGLSIIPLVCGGVGVVLWRISKLEDTIKNLENQEDKDNE